MVKGVDPDNAATSISPPGKWYEEQHGPQDAGNPQDLSLFALRVQGPTELLESGRIVRDGIDEAVNRRWPVRRDEGPERIGDHGSNKVLARYGGSVAHIEMRPAVVALRDQSLSEHPR